MDTIPAETLETLSQLFLQSLSPLAEHRRHAEAKLSDAGDSPFFSVALLRLLSTPAADLQVRLAAAIHLKNLLRSRYPSLPDPERAHLKSLLPSLMLASPPRVQPQLSESLSIVSSHDFPNQWPSLLPDLVANLRNASVAADYAAINGVLAAANSIFSKFRHSFDTNDLRRDLKYCLEHFASPLLEVFLKTAALIAAGNHAAPLFESQRLCCEIFYALNSIELPEFFEDHMKEWMGEFLVYLSTTYAGKVEAEGVVDSLRAAVCNNLQLYMEKNEEDFSPYLAGFATAVYNLLTTAPPAAASPSRDELTITAIKFLTTVSTSVHHSLFGSGDVLQQICGSIVFPNLRLRDEDEELFEMNFIEYIRRDIEGSDIDTRRRIVCELLRGLAMNYRDQVTQLVSGQIQNMLAAYAVSPNENWKEKDCAIYLVVSLGAKPAAGGAQLVDVNSFFANVIVPELQGVDVNAFPMLKAGALKFLTAFREQIPKNAAVGLLPHVIGLLRAESNVVHSYAANCIEKLLLVKDKVQTGLNVIVAQPRYNAIDIDPYLSLLITNLSGALKFPESQENQYVMKCIMRVLKVATIGDAAAKFCIDGLASILVEVCKNPKSPTFNHYLFEAIAALVGRSCEKDPLLIGVFEAKLFPVLQNILVNDISEFWPYAFQIFAQLVEISRPPLSENYMQIFQLLLSPESWTRAANVPALVRLLQAYLQKIPNELSNEGRLSQVLGIFHKLLTTPNREDLGFYVLNTVVENLSYNMIAPHIGQIWSALFFRLQGKRNVKIVNCLVIFMSLVLVKHGPTVLVDSINAVQPNIFAAILQQFWIPNIKLISGHTEVKLTSVASTRLICESPSLLDSAAVALWGKMLDSIIALLAQPEKNGVDLEADVHEIPENTGYSASFARLQNAGKKEEDPLKEINDPKGFLVTSLAKLSTVSPGRYPAIIEQYVDPANRAVLVQLCGTYNCTIV